ncbi:hypothetical protein RJ640_015213 [Escallonia rubra]|uniref:Transposase (putative) gypsy type domain-containing protein n=1 Tax=Escallonia rubra TaxID=112253 RepID=A0AA88UPS1_9ASTE|nr:hypothetical protein RJ640_015213 [Escallonia rubra]
MKDGSNAHDVSVVLHATTRIYEEQVKSGYRLPLHPFALSFFKHYRMAPEQLVSNGWRKLIGLIYLVETSGYKPDPTDFMRVGWYYIHNRQQLLKEGPKSNKSWHSRYFFVGREDKGDLPFDRDWNPYCKDFENPGKPTSNNLTKHILGHIKLRGGLSIDKPLSEEQLEVQGVIQLHVRQLFRQLVYAYDEQRALSFFSLLLDNVPENLMIPFSKFSRENMKNREVTAFPELGRRPFKVVTEGTSSNSPVPTPEEAAPLLWTWFSNHLFAAPHPTITVWVENYQGNLEIIQFLSAIWGTGQAFRGLLPCERMVIRLAHQ